MDDLDLTTPNCPDCLESMQPRAAWWFCQQCHVYVDVLGVRYAHSMDEWQAVEGTSWIDLPGFGRINPRRDDVDGGRQFFSAYVDNGERAEATGEGITQGPETYHFEFDQPFLLADRNRQWCVEMTISLLPGGLYGVRYRKGQWPSGGGGAW